MWSSSSGKDRYFDDDALYESKCFDWNKFAADRLYNQIMTQISKEIKLHDNCQLREH